MAELTESTPEAALNGARKRSTETDDTELKEALAAHSESLAAIIAQTDELDDAFTTAVLIAATADEDELEHIASSTANLIAAADGLSTEETAALAADLGESADDLADALEAVLELQRAGALDELIALAKMLSALEVDTDTVDGLNELLSAVGTAQRDAEPVGILGLLGQFRDRNVRAGIGYIVAILKEQGRRRRN